MDGYGIDLYKSGWFLHPVFIKSIGMIILILPEHE
jgi:hypothetical protein